MSPTAFVSRPSAFMAPRDHSLMGYSSFSTHESSSSHQVDPQALYPSFGMKPLQPLVPTPISAAKLPSLEGLLKKMQDDPSSPPSRGAHSPSFPHSEQYHRLSPAGREMVQMPSLRTIISPSMAKSASVLAQSSSGLLNERSSSPLGAPFAQTSQSHHQQQAHMAFSSRKRSWMEATPSAMMYPCKERAVSPAVSVSSPHASAASSTTGPHRSRASKYCKIEGCERVSQRNNLCHSHGGKRLCKEDKCSSKDRGNGYCIKHGGGKICSMENCEKKARRKGLCTQHFRVSDDSVVDGMAALHYASTI